MNRMKGNRKSVGGGLYRVYGEGRDPSGNSVVVYQVLLGQHMFCQECGRRMDQEELFSRGPKEAGDREQFSFCRICRPFSQTELPLHSP